MTSNGKVLTFPPSTFKAKLFEIAFATVSFKVAGTLEGFIDLATPESGTYPLSLDEARKLANALNESVSDVERNCLYEQDALLAKGD